MSTNIGKAGTTPTIRSLCRLALPRRASQAVPEATRRILLEPGAGADLEGASTVGEPTGHGHSALGGWDRTLPDRGLELGL